LKISGINSAFPLVKIPYKYFLVLHTKSKNHSSFPNLHEATPGSCSIHQLGANKTMSSAYNATILTARPPTDFELAQTTDTS